MDILKMSKIENPKKVLEKVCKKHNDSIMLSFSKILQKFPDHKKTARIFGGFVDVTKCYKSSRNILM
jgi:hypothetical protein